MKRTMKSEGRTRRARGGAAGAQNSRPQTGRSKKREREILDAAAEIFRRQGYADTSVQDVADAVGILKGSLYYYIDSKEDLLFRVLSEVHEDANEIIEEISASDAPPLERLAEYIRRHVEYNARNLSKIAVYYHDYDRLSPERRKVIRRQRALYEDLVISLITEAQERGIDLADAQAREIVYGMPYDEWKAKYQKEATSEQKAAFESAQNRSSH